MKKVYNTLRRIWLFLNQNSRGNQIIDAQMWCIQRNRPTKRVNWKSGPATQWPDDPSPRLNQNPTPILAILLTQYSLWLESFGYSFSSPVSTSLTQMLLSRCSHLKISCSLICPGLCMYLQICLADSALSNNNSPSGLLVCSFIFILEVWT